MEPNTDIIEIRPNGDPFGSGFTATMSTDGGKTWFYRGDIGARSEKFWRRYCKEHGYGFRKER